MSLVARGRYHAPVIPRCQSPSVSTVTIRLYGDCRDGAKTPGMLTRTVCPFMGKEPEVTTGRLLMEHVPMLLEVTLLIPYLVVDMDYQQCYGGLLKTFPVEGRF